VVEERELVKVGQMQMGCVKKLTPPVGRRRAGTSGKGNGSGRTSHPGLCVSSGRILVLGK